MVAAALFTITVTFALMPFSPALWAFSCLDVGFNLSWVLYQGGRKIYMYSGFLSVFVGHYLICF